MPNADRTTSLTARFVFPVAGPPLAGGCVTIAANASWPFHRARTRARIDLGNVAILPGLVNAHTHLEFSDCAVPAGPPGMQLPHWLAWSSPHAVRPATHALGSPQGLAESLRQGTCTWARLLPAGGPKIRSSQPLWT